MKAPTVSNIHRVQNAFTLVELLVIVGIVCFLALIHIGAFASANGRSKVAQCNSNLRQFAAASHMYGSDYKDQLPSFGAVGVGVWPWDVPRQVGDFMTLYGAGWRTLYCPGTAPRFTDAINLQLYNYGGVRVLGYVTTFPNTPALQPTNRNSSLSMPLISSGIFTVGASLTSERVLLADSTISTPYGAMDEALRYTFNYEFVFGGFSIPHTSPHLSGRLPLGGNVAMLDAHVEWRDFEEMHIRTINSGTPAFWW